MLSADNLSCHKEEPGSSCIVGRATVTQERGSRGFARNSPSGQQCLGAAPYQTEHTTVGVVTASGSLVEREFGNRGDSAHVCTSAYVTPGA